MSVQSTICILREDAIERILKINELLKMRNYKAIDETTTETDSVQWFVNNIKPLDDDIESLNYWTNDMIQDKINDPFYRKSEYENYAIFNTEEEIEESGMI